MKVTNVSVTLNEKGSNDRLLAFAEITLDEEFVVHNVRIVRSDGGPIVAMPNQRVNGEFQDLVHPINPKSRRKIRRAVFAEYNRKVPAGERLPT